MNKVFVVKNQNGLYLSKQQEWISGGDNQLLFRTPHRDEAINTVFETSSRDIYLRAEAVACEVDHKNNPVVTATHQLSLESDTEEESETAADNAPKPGLFAAETEATATEAPAAEADAATPPALETPDDNPHLIAR